MKISAALEWSNRVMRLAWSDQTTLQSRERAFPDDLDPTDMEQLIGFCHQFLEAESVRPTDLVGVVSREFGVVQNMEVPQGPDEEVRRMVHFQAEPEFNHEEGMTYDYVTSQLDEELLHVNMVAIPDRRIEFMQAIARSLGCQLHSIRFSSHLLIDSLRDHLKGEESHQSFVLAVSSRTVELLVAEDGHLKESHINTYGGTTCEMARAASSLVRRTLVAYGFNPEGTLPSIHCVATSENASHLADKILGELKRVQKSDALIHTLERALQSQNEGYDFLHPRRPQPPSRFRSINAIAAGVVAVMLLVGFVFSCRAELIRLDAELRELKRDERDLKNDVKDLAVFIDHENAVFDWIDSRVTWDDEYRAILEFLPRANDLFLTQVTFAAGRGSEVARIRLTGYAATQDVVTKTALALSEEERFIVRSGGLVPARNSKSYPWRFETEIRVLWPSDETTSTLDDSLAAIE